MADDDFDPKKFLSSTAPKPGASVPPGPEAFDVKAFLGKGDPAVTAKIDNPPDMSRKEQRTIPERVGQGFMDPVYGAAQMGARMQDPGIGPYVIPQERRDELISQIDKQVKDREEAIAKKSSGRPDIWRGIGTAANPINYYGAFVGGLPGAAVTGLTAALNEPVVDHTENFAQEKAKQALMGGVLGAGGAVATKIGKHVVSPIVGREVQGLMDAGIELTPGRLAGRLMSRMEDAARSIPFLGYFISGAQERTKEQFNLAAINQMLDRVGATLPAGTRAGREAMERADTLLDAEYRRLLANPRLGMTLDRTFLNDLAHTMNLVTELPPPMQEQFRTIIHNRLAHRLQQGGGDLSGRTLQDVQSAMREFETRYMKSPDPDQRVMAERFGEVRDAILDALERQNPGVAREFRDLRSAYAMFVRLQDASNRRAGSGGEHGVFSPMDLGAAVKKDDPTRRKSSYVTGDAILQEFAEWGQFVLPSRLPDSGTPERWLWGTLFGAGALGGHSMLPAVSDPTFIGAAGVIGAGSAAYSRPAIALMNYYADSAPWRRAVRNGMGRAEPAVGGAAAAGTMGATPTIRFDDQGNRLQ